ncbi:SPOR domain-containing protein [Chitinibacter sp. SCUT-21]|uniref:SPOR domain-containing protein n=1 Tax=Chitinibacter sp. SCUT-21 TaxID=2970891 RepID=UPI0035A732A5
MKSSRNSGRSNSNNQTKAGGSSLLTGLLVGLFVGIGIAVAVAVYLNYSGNPFNKEQTTPNDMLASGPETATTPPEILQPGNGKEVVPVMTAPPVASKPEAANASEDRFDFYKMLPEVSDAPKEATATSKPKASASPAPTIATATAPKPGLLQVGAFQNENDADNLKAKLALLGIESRIQTTELPEKGVWHRVRVGPFNDQAELDRTRNLLKNNGIDSTVVKAN